MQLNSTLKYFFLVVLFATSVSLKAADARIVLRSGDNPFSKINKENTTYVIKGQFDLNGNTIKMPASSTLKFKGGRFLNGTIEGKDTRIKAAVKKIFEANTTLTGTWDVNEAYPEWFGAKGDGMTDDTKSIRQCMWSPFRKRILFQRKTYIVNVEPGIDNNSQRLIFWNCKCSELIGKGTIIKLGDNDNCNLYIKKGFGALFSFYTIESLLVKGINFDFNYENNPIYQTQGIKQDIQENTQQNAFQFRRVRKVVIENCSFIGHSGTNCIDYNDARYDGDDKVFEVTIKNCKFLRCGGKSHFREGGSYVDAYHDCSTIAIHYRGNNHNSRMIVDVRNNIFEGIGGNAYNVIETDASELTFTRNTISGFASGIVPCAGIYNGEVTISNNTFDNVARGVVLWLRGGNDEDSDRYGFREVNIDGNSCIIDMGYWRRQSRYDNIESTVSNRYGFVLTTVGNNKSAQNIIIKGNDVTYKGLDKIEPDYCTKACINFESVSGGVKMMRCGNMLVEGNKFLNSPYRVLHNSLFQQIDNIVFNDNHIYKPFSVIAASSSSGGGVLYLNDSKAYAPSLDYPTVGSITAIGNQIDYKGYKPDDGCAVILGSNMKGKRSVAGMKLEVKNNTCTSIPQFGAVRFKSQEALFEVVEVEGIYEKKR